MVVKRVSVCAYTGQVYMEPLIFGWEASEWMKPHWTSSNHTSPYPPVPARAVGGNPPHVPHSHSTGPCCLLLLTLMLLKVVCQPP